MTPQEMLFILAIAFFTLAGVSCLFAIAVFFTRNVPDVYADLSGRKKAVAVRQMDEGRSGRVRGRSRLRERESGARAATMTPAMASKGEPQQAPASHESALPQHEAMRQAGIQPAFQADPRIANQPVAAQSHIAHSGHSAPTTILPDNNMQTVVFGQPAGRESASNPVTLSVGAAASFQVVKKIVFADSPQVLTTGQRGVK